MPYIKALAAFALAVTCFELVGGQTRVCDSTGWRCKEDCTGLGNGYSQWCGACGLALQCISEQTYYYYCAADHWWDEVETFCVENSTTCYECWDEYCGGWLFNMTENKYGVPGGWDALCYIDNTDENADKPCKELIKDMKDIGGGYEEFLAAGGNFGCWRGQDGMDGDYTGACRDNYQQDAVLTDCPDCDTLAVCVRHP